MKNLIFVFLFLIVILATSAQTFVFTESYRTFKGGDQSDTQTNVVWGQKSIGNRIGLFGWGQIGATYKQTYGGAYVQPFSWLQVGAGGGAEEGARLGSFAFASRPGQYIFAIYEDGGSGPWYLVLTDIAVSRKWSLGTHSQSFIGHGARAEYRLKRIGSWTPSIRPAITWNEKGVPSLILGLRFTYFKE